MKTEYILEYPISTLPIDKCASFATDWLNDGNRCHWIACANPHSYVTALKDLQFSEALRDADLLIPDGAGILLASQLLGGHINERVTGSDFFREIHRFLDQKGSGRVFLLGSTDQTLDALRIRLQTDFPNVTIAGTYSPPFKENYTESETAEMIQRINDSRADVLWVGLSAPKQEKWIYQNRHRLNVKFAAAVGAVFDFYTGNVKRSHPFFQKIGLEWLPRLWQEPRRLWRRMFISAPIFMLHVIREMNLRRSRKNISYCTLK